MSKSVSAVQAEEAAAKRKRNITIAAIVLGVLVAAGIAIALAGGSSKKKTADASNLVKVADTTALFAGIPQNGKVLGDPKAPVTMIEFADLQCPFCRQYSQTAFPQLVKDYVRTGKVKMQLETLAFLGPDSLKAGRAAAAAAKQNKLWNFADVMYNNQGTENSGYVTDKYLDAILAAAGADVTKANAFMKTTDSKQGVTDATNQGETYGVIQTPTFVAGPTAGKKDIITVTNTDPKSFAILDKMGQ